VRIVGKIVSHTSMPKKGQCAIHVVIPLCRNMSEKVISCDETTHAYAEAERNIRNVVEINNLKKFRYGTLLATCKI